MGGGSAAVHAVDLCGLVALTDEGSRAGSDTAPRKPQLLMYGPKKLWKAD